MKKTTFIIIVILSLITLYSCTTDSLQTELHGKWKSVNDESEVFVSEEMVLFYTGNDHKRTKIGKATVSFGEIKLEDIEQFCGDRSSSYFYEVFNDTLQFRVKNDNCNIRRNMLDNSKFIRD